MFGLTVRYNSRAIAATSGQWRIEDVPRHKRPSSSFPNISFDAPCAFRLIEAQPDVCEQQ